jgi:hypothetical protein
VATDDRRKSRTKGQEQELDRIARDVLYSLATRFKALVKDEKTVGITDVYRILNEASQDLFEKAVAATASTRMFQKTNHRCPSFTALKNLSSNAPIPDECSICPKLVECFNERKSDCSSLTKTDAQIGT